MPKLRARNVASQEFNPTSAPTYRKMPSTASATAGSFRSAKLAETLAGRSSAGGLGSPSRKSASRRVTSVTAAKTGKIRCQARPSATMSVVRYGPEIEPRLFRNWAKVRLRA